MEAVRGTIPMARTRCALFFALIGLLALPIGYHVVVGYVRLDEIAAFPKFSDQWAISEAILHHFGQHESDPNLREWCIFRPIPNLTYFLLARLFSRQIWLDHLFLYVWHVANMVLLCIFTMELTRNNKACAVIASTLFFFNQACTESVCQILGSHGLQMVFFALLSLIFLQRYILYGKHRYCAWAILCLNGALYTDESGAILPCYALVLLVCSCPGKIAFAKKIGILSLYCLCTGVYFFVRRALKDAPLVGVQYFNGYGVLLRNLRWNTFNILLPYRTMCVAPYKHLFVGLGIALICAYAGSLSYCLYSTKLRNRVFWFSFLCAAGYLAGVSNWYAADRVCYSAVPFVSLMLASLWTVEMQRTRSYFRFVIMSLYLLLLVNNYALVLLRTRDWATTGGINRKVMRIVADHFYDIKKGTIHFIGFNTWALLYLRGKPWLALPADYCRYSRWWYGMPLDEQIGETAMMQWGSRDAMARAAARGYTLRDSDFVIMLDTRGTGARYTFDVSFSTAGEIVEKLSLPDHTSIPTSPLYVNFQGSHACVSVDGFFIDEGAHYTSWRGYGWDRDYCGVDLNLEYGDVVDPGRIRASQQIGMTFVSGMSGRKAVWNLDIPNGRYYVTVGCWNPNIPHLDQTVHMEGERIRSRMSGRKESALEIEDVPVDIRDGRFTLELSPNRADVVPTISYLLIDTTRVPGGSISHAIGQSPFLATRPWWTCLTHAE